MKKRPILYSAPMVVAILDGRKTQTRRAIKSPARNMQKQGHQVIRRNPDNDPWYKDHIWSMRVDGGSWADYTHERFLQLCHYGAVGDRLWVREAWRVTSKLDDISPNQLPEGIGVEYPATRHINNLEGRKRPSIHMPRSLSRILTEVTDIRVQRLQDITPEEAKAEGLKCMSKDGLTVKFGIPDLDGYPGTDNHGWPWQEWEFDPVMAYKRLWEKINGKGSWDKNPWVWVIEFRKI